MLYYKFYSWGQYRKETICNLIHNRIFVQSIKNFNDPFEGRWYECNPESLIRISDKNFLERLERCGIYSLCAAKNNDFICSSKSVLMWSHYASSHFGFCVEFNEKILSEPNQFEFNPRKIDYHKVLPDKLSNVDYDDLSYKDKENLLFWKSDEWAYENEFRLCYKDVYQSYVSIPNDSINAIYCGCNMNHLLVSFFKRLCVTQGWKCYHLQKNNKKYGFYLI